MMKLEIYESPRARHPWRFRVLGRNGEIVCTGEGYTRPDSVLRIVRKLFGDRIKWRGTPHRDAWLRAA